MPQEDRLEIFAIPGGALVCAACEYAVQGEMLKSSEQGRRLTCIIRCVNRSCKHYQKPYKMPITKLVLEPA